MRLGMSEGAIAVRLHRGKLALRRALAGDLALIDPNSIPAQTWQETRIWCPLCGRHRLMGYLGDTGSDLLLRCHGCCPERDDCLTSTHLTGLFDSVKGYKPALTRLLRWLHDRYIPHLTSGVVPCLGCGQPTALSVVTPAAPCWLRDARGISHQCTACDRDQHTGSTLATGATFMAQILPPLLLGSVAGVFVDRWDRRRTMIIAELSSAVLLLPLLTVHTRADLPRVYIVAFLLAAIAQFFGPAKGALIPRLVDTAHLVRANALNALGDNIPRLVGPALGGALFTGLGLPGVLLTDSASFLLSGVLVLFIRVPSETAEAGGVPAPPALAASSGAMGCVWSV